VRLPVYPGKGGLIAGLDGLSNKARLDAVDSDARRNGAAPGRPLNGSLWVLASFLRLVTHPIKASI